MLLKIVKVKNARESSHHSLQEQETESVGMMISYRTPWCQRSSRLTRCRCAVSANTGDGQDLVRAEVPFDKRYSYFRGN